MVIFVAIAEEDGLVLNFAAGRAVAPPTIDASASISMKTMIYPVLVLDVPNISSSFLMLGLSGLAARRRAS